MMSELSLAAALERSGVLRTLIEQAWVDFPAPGDKRQEAASGLCGISIDHCHALQTLLPVLPGSAIALLRLQYESLVRAVWATYSANESALNKLVAPLSIASQKVAKSLPPVGEMLALVEKSGPDGAAALLKRARAQLGDGLNSFIHGGLHPFARRREGYPVSLLHDVLKNSNAMSLLTLILFAELADIPAAVDFIRALNIEFGDVLPALEPLQR